MDSKCTDQLSDFEREYKIKFHEQRVEIEDKLKTQCNKRISTEKEILAKELEENKNCESEI